MLQITLLALALRLLVACIVAKTCTAVWFFSQATELGCLANSVVDGHGLSSPFCTATGPSAFLAPGYPLVVATIFRAFGGYTQHSFLCVLFLQTLFSTLTIPVAMWLARRAFGIPVATFAGLLCALNPWLIGMEAIFWETSFSILLMTALVGLAVALQQQSTRGRWFAAALTLALGTAVNPSLTLTGITLFALSVLVGPRSARREWVLPAVLFVTFSSLWPARNLRAMHAFVPLRDNLGYELWQGNRADANGFFDETLHPNANRHEHQQFVQLGELPYMTNKSKLAKTWIASHPVRFAALTLQRIASFWLGIRPQLSTLLVLSTTVVTATGFVSLWKLFRQQPTLAMFFAAPLLVLPLPYYVTHPDFRFWCLLAPTLSVLSSWGLSSFSRERKSARADGLQEPRPLLERQAIP